MKIITIDNVIFKKADVLANRETVIKLRNKALAQSEFEYAIKLSFTIALLHHFAESMEE